jgi:hypothetical protein
MIRERWQQLVGSLQVCLVLIGLRDLDLVERGRPDQTSKIVRLGLLRKPVAFRRPIAISLCNAKCGAFLQVEDRCHNLRLCTGHI